MDSLNRRLEEARQARLDRTKSEIAARISCVCVHMRPQEFDELVQRMAEVQIKYMLRRSTDLFAETPDRSAEP